MADRMDEIFHDKHQTNRSILDALTPEDLILVRSVGLDQSSPNRVRALDVLVRAGFEQTARVLKEILQDPGEDVGVCAAAAAQLGNLGGAEAQTILIEALTGRKEPSVQIEIAGSLAKIGDPDSLAALGTLAEISSGATRLQAEFARSVIAYRHGIQDFKLPVPGAKDVLNLDREHALPFTISVAPFRETAMAFPSLARETYGMRFTRDLSFLIKCGSEQMLLVLDQHWFERGIVDVIVSRPLLLGLVGRRAQVNGSYSVAWLLLSWPQNDRHAHLAAHRPSGQQVLFGTVEITSKGLGFGVRSLRTPGAVQVELEGRFVDSKLEIMTALSGRSRITRRSPVPMELTQADESR